MTIRRHIPNLYNPHRHKAHKVKGPHLVIPSAWPSEGCGASLSRRKVPMAVAVHSSALLCRFQHLQSVDREIDWCGEGLNDTGVYETARV